LGKRLFKGLNNIFECLLQIIFPLDVVCTVCGKVIDESYKIHLCGGCLSQLKSVDKQYETQSIPLQLRGEGDNENKIAFDMSFSACLYEGLGREMVHRLKYKDRREISITMARMINEVLIKERVKYDYIVSVPISKKRLRKRGYNHSELIAMELSNITGIPYINALERIKDTVPQVLLNVGERWYNVKGVFKCNYNLHGKRVLLVDDVITTGATAHFCALQLKKSGAVIVVAASFAKSS
jgi:competence protein ComFC